MFGEGSSCTVQVFRCCRNKKVERCVTGDVIVIRCQGAWDSDVV